jgi:signal transduction histidine kinase
MGLSICLSIVRAHGGHIWHEACSPRGACFRLRLPLHAPA